MTPEGRVAPWAAFVTGGTNSPPNVISAHWTCASTAPLSGGFKDSEPIATRRPDGSWHLRGAQLDGLFRADGSEGLFADLGRSVENVLRATAIVALMPDRGLLFHAATLAWGDTAILFAGQPGAGKSTVSREGRANEVLTNEISIVTLVDGEWWAEPSPFWGHGDTARMSTRRRLVGAARLRHGAGCNEWMPLGPAAAAAALIPHIAVHGRGYFSHPRILPRIAEMVTAIPVFDFAWYRPCHPLEGSPWEYLARVEPRP